MKDDPYGEAQTKRIRDHIDIVGKNAQAKAFKMRKDAPLNTDDRFMWILDTYLDGRNAYFFEINNIALLFFIFFVIILFTHKENILKLKRSTENKIKL